MRKCYTTRAPFLPLLLLTTDTPIIIEDLRKSYGKVKVLDGVHFSVKRGEVIGLLGPNGAGKTTTVRILSTLLAPDSGRALVNGFDVATQANDVRHSIGLTGQYAAVDEYLTGEENLLMMGRLYRLSTSDAKERARDLLVQFDLVEASKRQVKTYSGGMRRRLDLAISLITAPAVLFLDEPTTGLDPRSRLTMWAIIKELAATDTTILLTTQHMEEADYLADRIVVLDKGKIIAEGTPDELKGRVGSERLELTLAQSANIDDAKRVMGGEGLQADPKRRTLSIATKGGVHDLRNVLAKLEEAHIEVESVSLHKPTLDDVFLALTGHAATLDNKETSEEETSVPPAA